MYLRFRFVNMKYAHKESIDMRGSTPFLTGDFYERRGVFREVRLIKVIYDDNYYEFLATHEQSNHYTEFYTVPFK